MTMIVTAHVGDCILIAADKRAMICDLATGDMKISHNNEQKIKLWCRGAVVGTGETIFLDRVAEHFIRVNEHDQVINQMNAIYDEVEKRILEGIPQEVLKNNIIFFSMFNGTQTFLYSIPIEPFFDDFDRGDGIRIIRPRMYEISAWDVDVTCFNLPPDMSSLQNFQHCLKPLSSFEKEGDFIQYYIAQLKLVFGVHAQIDSSITTSFDLYLQSCETGKNIAIHVPNLKLRAPISERLNYWSKNSSETSK